MIIHDRPVRERTDLPPTGRAAGLKRLFEVSRDRVAGRLPDVIALRGMFCGRRVPRVQAVRIRRRWFAGFRKECAMRASSFAIRFRLSDLAFDRVVDYA
jgi:hypothetical protein